MQEDSTYEHVKNDQIEKKLIIFEISLRSIWSHSWAANHARNTNLSLGIIKNDENLKNFEIHEISHEMHSPVDFSTSNIQISDADACVRRPHTYVSMGNLNI